MKTIPKKHHHLARMFGAQTIRPRQNTLPSFPADNLPEPAGHDFLVLSIRPDLTPQSTAAFPQAIGRAS